MSRVGKKLIMIPANVTVSVKGSRFMVTGPKGELEIGIPGGVKVEVDGDKITVVTPESNVQGMARTTFANAVVGVTTGWSKSLELNGTGYRATVDGSRLQMALGYSHQVVVAAPVGIAFEVKENKITVTGTDKGVVGQVAADVRKWRPADPYKIKGLKYENEVIIKKAGKAAKAGATTGGGK